MNTRYLFIHEESNKENRKSRSLLSTEKALFHYTSAVKSVI
jgi:hypothetical protein